MTMRSKGAKASLDEMLEDQNDSMTDKLAGKVELLRQISVNINKEIEGQNEDLDKMNDSAGDVLGSLEKTIGNLVGVSNMGGTRTVLVRAIGMFGFFLVVYFFSSRFTSEP
eukprot:CAMPEP_0114527868 /NCGR_PEP_ID=MMETSP0109-20121206/23868_1 /TAXON_ID=29199 /ORGANISM="Chlorarachnion reptans, Strain CCCM449" /LENGTH=110 /DNA_ID=CAMNT_0001709907 /DNA_START=22 /DNA_END=354 /DNA_ORIENTATION=+